MKYGYRYYVPWLGRWPNRDPIDDPNTIRQIRKLAHELPPKRAFNDSFAIIFNQSMRYSYFDPLMDDEDIEFSRMLESAKAPYAFCSNSPIGSIDLYGLTPKLALLLPLAERATMALMGCLCTALTIPLSYDLGRAICGALSRGVDYERAIEDAVAPYEGMMRGDISHESVRDCVIGAVFGGAAGLAGAPLLMGVSALAIAPGCLHGIASGPNSQ